MRHCLSILALLCLTRCTGFEAGLGPAIFLSPNGGLSFSSNQDTVRPLVTYFQGKFYVTWLEAEDGGSGEGQVRVAVHNPLQANDQWTFVDGNAATSAIKRSASSPIKYDTTPRLTSFGGVLYLSWSELHAATNRYRVRISTYNGEDQNPVWTAQSGENSQSGFNVNTSHSASWISLASLGETLYLIWSEHNPNYPGSSRQAQIKLRTFDGTTWTHIKRDPTAAGASDTLSEKGNDPSIEPTVWRHRGKLYAAWCGDNPSGIASQIRLIVHDPDEDPVTSDYIWKDLDGNFFTGPGDTPLSLINKDNTKDATHPGFSTYANRLYLIWTEKNSNDVSQVRVARYNEDDDAPSFSFVDGNQSDSGLNYDPTKNASEPKLKTLNNYLLAYWTEEGPNSTTQVRLSIYRGNNTWERIDGGGSTGLNYDTNESADQVQGISYNSYLYLVWRETIANGKYQNRVYRIPGDW